MCVFDEDHGHPRSKHGRRRTPPPPQQQQQAEATRLHPAPLFRPSYNKSQTYVQRQDCASWCGWGDETDETEAPVSPFRRTRSNDDPNDVKPPALPPSFFPSLFVYSFIHSGEDNDETPATAATGGGIATPVLAPPRGLWRDVRSPLQGRRTRRTLGQQGRFFFIAAALAPPVVARSFYRPSISGSNLLFLEGNVLACHGPKIQRQSIQSDDFLRFGSHSLIFVLLRSLPISLPVLWCKQIQGWSVRQSSRSVRILHAPVLCPPNETPSGQRWWFVQSMEIAKHWRTFEWSCLASFRTRCYIRSQRQDRKLYGTRSHGK